MTNSCKTVLHCAISTGPDTHLDHLAPLCALMQMPLIVTDDTTYQLARIFYPQVETLLKYPDELTLDYLASFDMLFQCGKFWAADLLPLMQFLYHKQPRIVFCPHGNSDKGQTQTTHVAQDIALIYGDHMRSQLAQTEARAKIAMGNLRYPFYLKHQAFYDDLTQEHVFSRFTSQKETILYAPTWQDRENTSSFFDSCEQLIAELSPRYNLIIKLHPLLEEQAPALTTHIGLTYENHPSVLFLAAFPPIYPLLNQVACYIGDYSSIGYDFLAFDKPLFFLNPSRQSLCLHECGMTITDIGQVGEKMAWNQQHYAEKRQEIYRYAFGDEWRGEELRRTLFALI